MKSIINNFESKWYSKFIFSKKLLIINIDHKFHSIGVFPILFKYSLQSEKCLHDKKPWCADNGDGWDVFNILFFVGLTDFALVWAGFPQSKYTTPVQFLLIVSITSSVNFCHPHWEWEFGLLSSTVKLAFRRKTPCSAHLLKSPWFGALKFSLLSFYRFL